MSLLREIQDAAIDANVELATLLRKCKVLAARLGNSEFKHWVENELSGYDSIENLPDYRILTVISKGHFFGAFGSGLRNADIPLSCIPEKFREDCSHSYLIHPIAAIEDLVKDSDAGLLQEPWNSDFVAYIGQGVYENLNCLQAWKVIPKSSLIATLDAVRNRILNFVLEIEAEAPNAGEAPLNSNPVPQEKVSQIFYTYINGSGHNISTVSSDFSQSVEINSGLNEEIFNNLLEAIRQSAADVAVINQLTATVEEMRANQGKNSFRTHYLSFMSVLADHMQVLGPAVAIYLPQLAALVR